MMLYLPNDLILEPITTFRLGAERNVHFTAVDKSHLVKRHFGSPLTYSTVSERPVTWSFIKLC